MSPQVANIIVNTLTTGSVIALIAVGFVVMYRATKVVSFAQGGYMVVAALIFARLAGHGLGLYPAMIVVIAINLLLGALTYRIAFARIVGAEPFVTAMATIGLATVLEACAIMIWGSAPIVLPHLLPTRSYHIVSNLSITASGIFSIVAALVVFGLLIGGIQRTALGLRMRAVADHPRLAAYSGVNVVGMSMLAWALAAGTAAVAGIAFTLTAQPSAPNIYALGLLAFPAILLGGFDSVVGALVGGFLLALTQSIVTTYAGGKWQDVVSYGVLLVVLLIRPQGLFGSAEATRV